MRNRIWIVAACCGVLVSGVAGCGGGDTGVRPSVKRGTDPANADREVGKQPEKAPDGK
jgi:hypothetical protein